MMDALPDALSAVCTRNGAMESIAVVTILLFLAIFTVILRFYVRTCLLRNTGYDDYLILASLVSICYPLSLEFNSSDRL